MLPSSLSHPPSPNTTLQTLAEWARDHLTAASIGGVGGGGNGSGGGVGGGGGGAFSLGPPAVGAVGGNGNGGGNGGGNRGGGAGEWGSGVGGEWAALEEVEDSMGTELPPSLDRLVELLDEASECQWIKPVDGPSSAEEALARHNPTRKHAGRLAHLMWSRLVIGGLG